MELSKSGYDSSRIQQRPEMITKVPRAKQERDEADSDEIEDGEDEEGWM